jgi:putative transposase
METQQAALAPPQPTRDDPTIWRVDDAMWAELRPLLVVDKPRKKPGRKRSDKRPILDGLIWLARTGAQWAAWPRAACGPKATAHDRLQAWVAYGCRERAWACLLAAYDGELGLQGAWLAAAGCIVQAPLGKKGAAARPKRPGATPLTAPSVARSATC